MAPHQWEDAEYDDGRRSGGWQWGRALEVFERMEAGGVEPNIVVFSAAIAACDKARPPTRELGSPIRRFHHQ